jgi:hypothetical protein
MQVPADTVPGQIRARSTIMYAGVQKVDHRADRLHRVPGSITSPQ